MKNSTATSYISKNHHAMALYAERGLAVFPIGPKSKAPLTSHGFKDATTEQSVIRRWFEKCPTANVGMATGLVSGIGVLDIDQGGDTPDAMKTLLGLEQEFGKIPDTPCGTTGNYGIHLFFAVSEDLPSRTRMRPGLDFKCAGGYVVAAPSIHPNGRPYEWDSAYHILETPLAPIPAWLRSLVLGGESSGRRNGARKPLTSSEWLEIVKCGAPVGARNDLASRLSGYLLSRIDPRIAREFIKLWNSHRNPHPLPESELMKTFESIAERELKKIKRVGA